MPLKNLQETSSIFGVNINTLRAWLSRGCPYVQRGSRGRSWTLDTAQVFEWNRDQAALAAIGDTSKLDVDEARRRKLAAEAALQELELSKARGDVIALADVGKIWLDIVASCRSQLLAIPSKVAPILAVDSDLRTIRDTLDAEIEQCLSELSRFECGEFEGIPDTSQDDDQSDVVELSPTAEINNQ